MSSYVTKNKNISIQLLRISACLMVFMVHFGQRTDLSGILRSFTDFGRYGVQLFFLISGFLAAKTFIDKPNSTVIEYYKKRAIAILPLYYITIIYYFFTENLLNHFKSVIPPDELGVGWLRYIFLLNGFLNSETYFWSNLGITWTIPIFATFYLIAPWILRKAKSIASTTVIWLIIFVTTGLFSLFYSCQNFTYIHIFFLGAVLYSCTKHNFNKQASVLFLLISIVATIVKKEEYTYTFIFASIVLILVSIENLTLPNKLQKLVNTLDSYSYTLYLMHGIFFCSILDRLNQYFEVSKIIIAIIAIVGTALATWIVGKYIEKPIQKYLRNKLLNKD